MIEWLRAGNGDVRVDAAGDGDEAVVFVHGNPGSADDWSRYVAAASDAGLRALAPDLPDFGETLAPDGFEHSMFGYGDWLRGALEEWGVRRAHFVLHDLGGPIGLTLVAMNVVPVASVTLIDTGLMPGYRWHPMARLWRTPVAGELFQAITNRRGFAVGVSLREPRGLPDEFIDSMWSHYDRRTRRAVLRFYRATDEPGGAAVGLLARALAPRDIPALVIWGERDGYLPSAYAQRQRDAFPSAEVHVIPGSGHWPYADAPERVEELLMDFLGRVRSGARAANRY
jgi:pimeloyl-ACP methyl ester carboxylesterase